MYQLNIRSLKERQFYQCFLKHLKFILKHLQIIYLNTKLQINAYKCVITNMTLNEYDIY